MVLFDTNIFIYAGIGQLKLSRIDGVEACYASVSVIETLGFHEITSVEQRKLTEILDSYQKVDLNDSIIRRAVSLRQDKRMSLGDSIVAATAVEESCVLWTVNVKDFSHIADLEVYNPLV